MKNFRYKNNTSYNDFKIIMKDRKIKIQRISANGWYILQNNFHYILNFHNVNDYSLYLYDDLKLLIDRKPSSYIEFESCLNQFNILTYCKNKRKYKNEKYTKQCMNIVNLMNCLIYFNYIKLTDEINENI